MLQKAHARTSNRMNKIKEAKEIFLRDEMDINVTINLNRYSRRKR